jgi:hypothetical protein
MFKSKDVIGIVGIICKPHFSKIEFLCHQNTHHIFIDFINMDKKQVLQYVI